MVTAAGLVGWVAFGGRSATQPAGDPVAVERRVLRTTVVALGVLGDDGVELAVPEVDAPRLEPGQEVEVRFDAAPDDVLGGAVAGVAARAQTIEGRTLVAADVDLDGAPPGGILPGMTATVTIVIGRRADVTMVPLVSVRQQSDQPTVRLGDGTDEPVRLGERDGTGWRYSTSPTAQRCWSPRGRTREHCGSRERRS